MQPFSKIARAGAIALAAVSVAGCSEYLDRRAIASVYRVHEKPDPKKVLEFEQLAQAFGYSLGVTDLAERRIAIRHGQAKPQSRSDSGH